MIVFSDWSIKFSKLQTTVLVNHAILIKNDVKMFYMVYDASKLLVLKFKYMWSC